MSVEVKIGDKVYTLGQKVSYVRVVHTQDGAEPQHVESTGIFVGVHLNVDQRAQARIIDNSQPINVDLPAIDATPEGAQAYFAHVTAIQKHAEKVNAEVKTLVEEGNKHIAVLNTEFLGEIIEIQPQDTVTH